MLKHEFYRNEVVETAYGTIFFDAKGLSKDLDAKAESKFSKLPNYSVVSEEKVKAPVKKEATTAKATTKAPVKRTRRRTTTTTKTTKKEGVDNGRRATRQD